MKERDTQRAKLYRAEEAALKRLCKPLPTVQDIERYLREQSQLKPLRSRYGMAVDVTDWPLEVSDGRGRRRARAYDTHTIAIPLWARNNWLVLHEWAHIVHSRLGKEWRWTRCREGIGSRSAELRGGAPHGWQYAAVYLDLVRFCIGKDAAEALKVSFKERKVRFKPRRTRTATPGQIEHLAAMRLAARPR